MSSDDRWQRAMAATKPSPEEGALNDPEVEEAIRAHTRMMDGLRAQLTAAQGLADTVEAFLGESVCPADYRTDAPCICDLRGSLAAWKEAAK